MNTSKLSAVLRKRAHEMIQSNAGSDPDVSDTAELCKVLARILEGIRIEKAFGAPGDWGYETPIGEALAWGYRNSVASTMVQPSANGGGARE